MPLVTSPDWVDGIRTSTVSVMVAPEHSHAGTHHHHHHNHHHHHHTHHGQDIARVVLGLSDADAWQLAAIFESVAVELGAGQQVKGDIQEGAGGPAAKNGTKGQAEAVLSPTPLQAGSDTDQVFVPRQKPPPNVRSSSKATSSTPAARAEDFGISAPPALGAGEGNMQEVVQMLAGIQQELRQLASVKVSARTHAWHT